MKDWENIAWPHCWRDQRPLFIVIGGEYHGDYVVSRDNDGEAPWALAHGTTLLNNSYDVVVAVPGAICE
jgi:hypothetical protein